ncbi:YciI family protein [Paenibacillus thalictri]|uniref:YCII-related domain-containing protein n=1 Tax=Paenibacillus thalictri TaxID=2527873 RepID=A0A4Q9DUT0_9BACL|nr:YciI family protein [Paenibacillus thalictri]TBL78540.1 hypothetical protein EYB31_13620 [Paenibacillus thalictri]
MKTFLVFIQRKPGFTGASIPGHREHLTQLREQDRIVLAGGFPDQTGGAYVVKAEDHEAAAKLVELDPMFAENECVYVVKEWNAQ